LGARIVLRGGARVVRAWGFGVVSEIVWDKINFGLGKFPRPQHEILLVCRRGKLPFQVNNAPSVQRWHAPRAKGNRGRIHSAKPEGSYDLIRQASPGPYLELFSRAARLGWATWGDEALHGTEAMVV
jgi:N6-adenosine-specific RNA methylase IME4